MDLVIITGISGAGKSQAINALEDIGYYCVDNVPPPLIEKFAELSAESGDKIPRIALVVDVRSKDMFTEYIKCLEDLKNGNYHFRTLFLDCNDATLLRRYKETRRRHPLMNSGISSIEEAIKTERSMLSAAKAKADFAIDTSLMTAIQLRSRLHDLFEGGVQQTMLVQCTSFGYKYGTPADSDLLFDVRCLPNPFYVNELRNKTGLDEDVKDYVMSFEQTQGLIPKLLSLIDYLMPLYVQEGKSQLVISVGCTGGKHRSVVLTELLAAHLSQNGTAAHVAHRDISVGK